MTQNEYNAPSNRWGTAILYTRIDETGRMWVGRYEYETQVNFCPMTGEKAPVQMKSEDAYYSNEDELVHYKKYTDD